MPRVLIKMGLLTFSGYLKAVWPKLLGCFWRSGRPRGSRAPEAGQTSTMHQQKSGQTAFGYLIHWGDGGFHEWNLELVSGAVPGALWARRGPQGAENRGCF